MPELQPEPTALWLTTGLMKGSRLPLALIFCLSSFPALVLSRPETLLAEGIGVKRSCFPRAFGASSGPRLLQSWLQVPKAWIELEQFSRPPEQDCSWQPASPRPSRRPACAESVPACPMARESLISGRFLRSTATLVVGGICFPAMPRLLPPPAHRNSFCAGRQQLAGILNSMPCSACWPGVADRCFHRTVALRAPLVAGVLLTDTTAGFTEAVLATGAAVGFTAAAGFADCPAAPETAFTSCSLCWAAQPWPWRLDRWFGFCAQTPPPSSASARMLLSAS